MSAEAIITLIPFGSVLASIIVTAAIVWFITAYFTNLRWKRIFWPHADTIAKQKITEQKRQIDELTKNVGECDLERVRYKKKVEAISQIVHE